MSSKLTIAGALCGTLLVATARGHSQAPAKTHGHVRQDIEAVVGALEAAKLGDALPTGSGLDRWVATGQADHERVRTRARRQRASNESPEDALVRKDRAQSLAKARLARLRDAAEQRWQSIPGPLLEELSKHARRMATLRRIVDVAIVVNDSGAMQSASDLLYVERQCHAAAIRDQLKPDTSARRQPVSGDPRQTPGVKPTTRTNARADAP